MSTSVAEDNATPESLPPLPSSPLTLDHCPAAAPALENAPTLIGYDILGELGQGAMGVVYRARQRSLNRIVALKIARDGGPHCRDEPDRFRTEAETIAALQHPNIIQIHEVGEQNGLRFIALEYATGGSLAERIARQPLTPLQAAHLVRTLADALHCVHCQGIVHRDLKPANVLLTGSPDDPLEQCLPKVSDFGLVKRLSETGQETQEGTVVGTPNYMAPEQARGLGRAVGPVTDVYALGAILYELLTGRPPFVSETIMGVLEQVIQREPTPPRQLQVRVPIDLQTICLKCLEKDPRCRYASAGELAQDVQRFLAGEPIHARAARPWERVWKWTRKRPAAAALLVLAVLGPAVIGINGYATARRERLLRETAEAHAREAARQETRAEENLAEAREAIHYLTRLGHQRLELEPQLQPLRRELLQRALDFHQRFLHINGNDAAQLWQVAQAHLRVGQIQEMLGELRPALRAHEQARTILTELMQRSPDQGDYCRHLAAALHSLGVLHLALAEYPAAAARFEEAVLLWRQLVEVSRGGPDLVALARVYNGRGLLRQHRNAFPEATEDHQEALKLLNDAGTTVDPEAKEEWARTLGYLGHVWEPTQPARSEHYYAQAQTLWGELADSRPREPRYQQRLGEVYLNRGTCQHKVGQLSAAEKNYREAIRRLQPLAEKFHAVPDFVDQLATASGHLGQLLIDQRSPKAKEAWEQSVGALKSLLALAPEKYRTRQRLGLALNELAISQVGTADEQAIACWEEAVRIQARLAAEKPKEAQAWKEVLESQENLTRYLTRQRRVSDAEKACRAWVKTLQQRADHFAQQPTTFEDWAEACQILSQLLKAQKNEQGAKEQEQAAEGHRKRAAQLKHMSP